MVLWSKVLSGFDTDDETINFGTRAVAENGGSFYETSTIATIQPNEQVTETPNVLASLQCSRLCIAIDNSITVFENETCQKILLSNGFESLISCYCISEDGLFLFIVLSTGMLYCLHLPTGGKTVFSVDVMKHIYNEQITIDSCETNDEQTVIRILLIKTEDSAELILVTRNGAIYRISKFNPELIDTNSLQENEITNNTFLENLQYSQLFAGLKRTKVLSIVETELIDQLTIIMVTTDTLFVWPTNKSCSLKPLSYRYTKAEYLRTFKVMLCLRTDGILDIVCPRTLLGYKVYNGPVTDFSVIDSNDNYQIQIILLSRPVNIADVHTLCFVSFPGFEKKFQINVSNSIRLMKIIDTSTDIVPYIEGLVNDMGNINAIRVKAIVEAVPERRLERLLKRKQFEEAILFAKKFSLKMEKIYCAKASAIVDQLGPGNNTETLNVNMLIEALDKIENVQYIVDCCRNIVLSDFKQMKTLFIYIRTRITHNPQNDDCGNNLSRINDRLNRLETFVTIYSAEVDNENYRDQVVGEWTKFLQADLLDECKSYLRMGAFEPATLIWTRHLSDVVKDISVASVHEIFSMIPSDISPPSVLPWLSHFVPSLLSLYPDAMQEVISWGYKKIKSLEATHQSDWPEIGIKFAEEFTNLLRPESRMASICFDLDYVIAQNTTLKQVTSLLQTLTDLNHLKSKYWITVPLNLYEGDATEVAHTLLDTVRIDKISAFFNEFLKQYMLNHSLKNDDVITLYIQKILRNSQPGWCWEEAPWEGKVAAVVVYIQDMQKRLEQTIQILKKASIPWSPIMESLADNSSTLDVAASIKIKTERNHIPVRLILRKYGYETVGINNRLIRRIIKQNRPEMISDLNELTKNDRRMKHEAISYCITYHLRRGNVTLVRETLNGLEDDILYYFDIIINSIIAELSLKHCPAFLEYFIELLNYMRCKLQDIPSNMKSQSYECKTMISHINDLKSLYYLWTEFDIRISLNEYRTEKQEVLQSYIKRVYSNEANTKASKLSWVCARVLAVTNLLQLERMLGVSLLVEQTHEMEILKTYMNHENPDVTEDECGHLHDLCVTVLQSPKLDAETARIVRNFCASALSTCPDSALSEMVLLHVWTHLYWQTFGKPLATANVSQNPESPEVETKWRLYSTYKDMCNNLDPALEPILKNALLIHVLHSDRTHTATPDSEDQVPHPDDMESPSPREMLGVSLDALLRRIRELRTEHTEVTLLRVLKMLYFGFCSLSSDTDYLLDDIRNVLVFLLDTLLNKLVNMRSRDIQLGLSCLFMYNVQEAREWILTFAKMLEMDYPRHATVVTLGYEYLRLARDQTNLSYFVEQKTLHWWAERLCKYSIAYKEILQSSNADKRHILYSIMNNKNEDVIPLLQDFCITFSFNINDSLVMFLQMLCEKWAPTLKQITSSTGKTEVHIEEKEVNDLRKKCTTVLAAFTVKDYLQALEANLWNRVNFYHYEVFLILLDIMGRKSTAERSFLHFLLNYTRSGRPTQKECELWMQRNATNTSLPPIAQWRLPFLPKGEMWTLIRSSVSEDPELNMGTYKKWLHVTAYLEVETHVLCTLAIKGEVNKMWVNVKERSEKWSLNLKYSNMLNEIDECAKHITGPDALYYGTVALHYVMNSTPPGADQVAAAKLCYDYALNASRKPGKFEEGMLEKVRFKYLKCAIEHVLHKHCLAKDNYLALVHNPVKLVNELYTDESIPLRYRTITDYRPDINSAVSEIHELTLLNLYKTRLGLLREWLQPESTYTGANHSITETVSIVAHPYHCTTLDDNLYRACYILEYGNIEHSANFLINIGFDDNNKSYLPEMRYRALYVLQAITDPQTLQSLTMRDPTTIRQYMKSLKYLGTLSSFGICYNVKSFEACSKHDIVQILWNGQSHSQQAIGLVAQICIDYKINEYKLWNDILTRMVKLKMIDELGSILLKLGSINCITNCNGYVAAWQVVITDPFKRMEPQPTSEQISHCITCISLLHSCAVIHGLQFSQIVQYCFRCHQAHLAAALLPYLNDAEKEYVLTTIRNKFDVSKVIEDLKHLSVQGVLTVPQCLTIIQEHVSRET